METKMRKIMVEVTPQEYQKILTGGLGKLDEVPTQALYNELVKRSRLDKSYLDTSTNIATREYVVSLYSNGEIRLKIIAKQAPGGYLGEYICDGGSIK